MPVTETSIDPVNAASLFLGRPVGDVAAHLAGATTVFHRQKIDFCCGADVSLAEAARKRGVDAQVIAAQLVDLSSSVIIHPLHNKQTSRQEGELVTTNPSLDLVAVAKSAHGKETGFGRREP
jgi:hypothetical protein